MPVAVDSPYRQLLSRSTGSHSMVTARAVSAPAPTTLSASARSMPATRPRRRAASISAAARSASPESEAQMADTSAETRGSSLPSDDSSGHIADGSLLASADCRATWLIFGVKRLLSTLAISSLAASASPIRSNSHARSAAQSAGSTSAGLYALANRALRRPMCAQREASGASIRRINISSDLPLAPPHGASPRPSPTGSSAPARLGSRLANFGYSTCDCASTGAVSFASNDSTISTADPSTELRSAGAAAG